MKINEFEKIIKDGERNCIGFVTKLEIVSYMMEYDSYKELSEESKEKLLDYSYSYWMDEELVEHTLYDFIEAIFNSNQYIGFDIVNSIDKLNYKNFVDLIEEKSLL